MKIELIVHTANFNSRSFHVLAKYQNSLRPQNYAFHREKKSHCLLTKRLSVVSILLFTTCVTMGKVPKVSVPPVPYL